MSCGGWGLRQRFFRIPNEVNAMIPTPKYAIGACVWDVDVQIVDGRHPCPDCGDTRQWTATSAIGETFQINCLRCSQSYANLPRAVPPLTYRKATYSVRALTIGSVKIDTSPHYSEPVQYMCVETGVGSGRVYNESSLFASEADARQSAEEQTRAEQARLDVGPVNPIRAELATLTLSAAMPHVWQEDMYHAWVQYRDLRDTLREILDDKAGAYDLSDDTRTRIEEELQDKPWHRSQPVAVLIAAVRADLHERTDATWHAVADALVRCTSPERRPISTAKEVA